MKKLFPVIRKLSESKFVVILITFAFVIRLSYSFIAYKSNIMDSFMDDLAYKHFGEQVLEQGLFVPDLEALGSYAGVVGPGIGWILGFIFFCFGVKWMAIFIVNSLVGALTCYVLYLLGKNVCNKRIAFYSSFYLAIYIPLIRYTPTAGKEVWMTFLFVSSVYLALKVTAEKRTTFWLLLLAILYTFLIHLDERFLFFAPVFFFFLLSGGINTDHQRLRNAGIFAILVIILSVPWLIRNYKVYDRIILISVRTNAVSEKIFGYEKKKYYEDDYTNRWYIGSQRIDSVKSGLVTTFDNGREIMPQQIEAIRKGKVPRDFSKAETMWASFKRFWQPFLFGDGMYFDDGHRFISWSLRHNLIVIFFYSWMLLLIPFGFYVLYNCSKQGFFIFGISIFLYTLIHVILIPFTSDRYRIPLDPILILIGITGLVSVCNYIFKDSKQII